MHTIYSHHTFLSVTVICDRERKLMASVALLFVVILTTISKVTSLHCSDQHLPASGDDDPQQVTTLQYCLVDNCTIMMIDTGEELDIVYTTDSLIVATPTNGLTSMVIAKLEEDLPCFTPSTNHSTATFIGTIGMALLIATVSGYNFVVHLVFKQLREPVVGRLLLFYSLALVLRCSIALTLLMMHLKIEVNSQVVCQIGTISYQTASMIIHAFGACILTHIAYVMRCNYHISRVSKEMSESLFKRYMVYILGMVMFFLVAMISFDVITGAGRYTLQPDGHCILINHPLYDTIWLPKISLVINKYIQIAMFAVFLYYFYKLNHRQDISSEPGICSHYRSHWCCFLTHTAVCDHDNLHVHRKDVPTLPRTLATKSSSTKPELICAHVHCNNVPDTN